MSHKRSNCRVTTAITIRCARCALRNGVTAQLALFREEILARRR
jgi:hypothetical protein